MQGAGLPRVQGARVQGAGLPRGQGAGLPRGQGAGLPRVQGSGLPVLQGEEAARLQALLLQGLAQTNRGLQVGLEGRGGRGGDRVTLVT